MNEQISKNIFIYTSYICVGEVLPIELYLTVRYINEHLTDDIRTFFKYFQAERSIYHMLGAKVL